MSIYFFILGFSSQTDFSGRVVTGGAREPDESSGITGSSVRLDAVLAQLRTVHSPEFSVWQYNAAVMLPDVR
jgi:hypothetical protein